MYDGHGEYGREASLVANREIRSIIRKNSKKLSRAQTQEEVIRFLKKTFTGIQKRCYNGQVSEINLIVHQCMAKLLASKRAFVE